MKIRLIALFLCLASLVTVLAGCAGSIDATSEDKGQQITMYLTETVYDLDPAHAYINESSRTIVGLLFDTLFVLDEKGKVKPSLAESYTIEEDDETGDYFMYITLANTNWSDNTAVTADDVVYAWKRVLSYKNSFEAASLLFDIKNARLYNEGEVSKDDIGITADGKVVTIQFEKKIDYDAFLLNLTSLALAPLRENIVEKSDDWAKKPGTMVCSGPFKLSRISFAETGENRYYDSNYDEKKKDQNGNTVYIPATTERREDEQIVSAFVLERNSYYYRDSAEDEKLDKSVAPYRILVDCAMSDADIKEAYENGTILYVGDIPMSLRLEYKDEATVKDSLSATTIYFNQNKEIDGEKLFANKTVRQALSMVIDRQAIADALVFAEAATGLVPTGVFNTNSPKKTFRSESDGNFKYLTCNIDEAKKLLKDAGIDASDYSFTLTYATYDEVHAYVAEAIVKAWQELGFDAELNKRGTIANNDYYKFTDDVPADICDDLWAEDFRSGNFDAILVDSVAISADPFSVLAPYAKQFSGMGMDMSVADNYELTPHLTGYDSEAYNTVLEEAFAEEKDARAAKLHEAEAILMEDMPVIPVVFNKTAYLTAKGLDTNNKTLFWKKSSNYYGADTLKYAQAKSYDKYIETCADFLESKFEEYASNPLSYFGSETYRLFTFEEFKQESSNYSYLFKDKE